MFPTALLACFTVVAPTLATGPTTTRVSISYAEGQGSHGSNTASISADGRYVAFASYSKDLVANDTNGDRDIFVRDRVQGTTERASISSAEREANRGSYFPSISADGRYVAFQSAATDLVANDTNGARDIFVRDRLQGTTERASISSVESQGNRRSSSASISADGRYVAFESYANDLVAGDTNSARDIFVRDREKGTTERVSISSGGDQADSGESFGGPAISADGRYIAFASSSSDLIASDTNGASDVFVHDLHLGTTMQVSISSGEEQATGANIKPAISADGRYVAFESYAHDLIANDTNGANSVFVRDRHLGTTMRVSIGPGDGQATGYSFDPALSADGRYVAFSSLASGLVPNDTNSSPDVFVRGPLDRPGERACPSGAPHRIL